MNILVINWQDRTHPQAGGAEVHLHEIFGRLATRGHNVTLLCCGFQGALAREVIDGINVVRFGSRPWFNYAVRWWWLWHGRTVKADVVVDDINKLPFFTPRFVRKPILALIHHFFGDSIYTEVGRLAGRYVQWYEDQIGSVYRNTTICTVSDSSRDECIARGLPAEHVSVIYNAIDPTLFPMAVTEKSATPTLVYFGRLKRYKSVDHILRALVEVRKQIPNVQLEVLGSGDDGPHLEHVVRELGLEQHVTFHGFVTDEHKAEHLTRAHLAVNPSIKEGWGITNLEANACGTPVVSADVPGLRDSVKPGVSGMLYEYGNIAQLASIIVRLLTEHDLRNQLSHGAVEWASTFTWDRSAEQMLALCEQVVRQQS